MCTVTFIPLKGGEYIFTHNRDEKLSRKSSLPPKERTFGKQKLIYPVDADKNGTWFCCDKENRVICILNGAYKKHVSQPPYKKSRGIVVLEAFLHNSFHSWIETVDLRGIEPFTMVLFEKDTLIEFRWDENQKHTSLLPTTQPHIWSSATLYTKEAIHLREKWLAEWLKQHPSSPESLFQFHNYGGESTKETKLKMEIMGSHQTVSITQLHLNKLDRKMKHVNFVSQEKSNLHF